MHIIQSIYLIYTWFMQYVYSLYAVKYPNIPHAKQAECSGFWQGLNVAGVSLSVYSGHLPIYVFIKRTHHYILCLLPTETTIYCVYIPRTAGRTRPADRGRRGQLQAGAGGGTEATQLQAVAMSGQGRRKAPGQRGGGHRGTGAGVNSRRRCRDIRRDHRDYSQRRRGDHAGQ